MHASYEPRSDPNRKRSRLPGCALGCLFILLTLVILGYGGYRFIRNQIDTVVDRFEREGYSQRTGQFLDVKDTLLNPTVFLAQEVTIRNGSDRGIAILAQKADLHGPIEGNVHFIGQIVTVHEDAVLKRDLDVKAQVVNVFGTVEGKITGAYRTLKRDSGD